MDMSKFYGGISVQLSETKRKNTAYPSPPSIVEEKVKVKPTVKAKVTKPTNTEVSTSKRKAMLAKLEDELFESFNVSDWIEYFRLKAEPYKVDLRTITAKDTAIFKSLMSNYRVNEIRDMIDFVWDAPHTIKPKDEIRMWILSGGWINDIFNKSQKWKRGEFNNNPSKPKREWSDWKEVSPAKQETTTTTVEVINNPPKRKKFFI